MEEVKVIFVKESSCEKMEEEKKNTTTGQTVDKLI